MMAPRSFATFALGLLAACASSKLERQTVELDQLQFEVPADWRRSDSRMRDSATAVWAPAENERKETIAVIISRRPATATADAATLERLLESAQRGLPKARVVKVTPFSTTRGLSGVRVEVDYVPEGLRTKYHRVHATLGDGQDVINILYTAQRPDKSVEAFNIVVDSIRHKEG